MAAATVAMPLLPLLAPRLNTTTLLLHLTLPETPKPALALPQLRLLTMATMDSWALVLDDTDLETARLVISLQMQDLHAHVQNGSNSVDSEIARGLFVRDIAE